MIKPVKRLTDCYERACKNIIGLSILQGSVILLTNTILIENRVNIQIYKFVIEKPPFYFIWAENFISLPADI